MWIIDRETERESDSERERERDRAFERERATSTSIPSAMFASAQLRRVALEAFTLRSKHVRIAGGASPVSVTPRCTTPTASSLGVRIQYAPAMHSQRFPLA